MSDRDQPFELTKYYLDAADVWGNVYIGYWLRLRWGEHTLSGQQHLLHTPARGVRTRTTLGSAPPPDVGATQAHWPAAQAHGVWHCANPVPLAATPLATPAGRLAWCCALPRADAHIELPNLALSGRGYVERLDLTLPVWQLGLHTLYWGRAHSANHTLVWIHAVPTAGAPLFSTLWLDGVAQPGATIDGAQLATARLALALPRDFVLRDGPLSGHLLHPVLHALDFLPAAALALTEHKFYGLAILTIDGRQEQVTVLHEVVQW